MIKSLSSLLSLGLLVAGCTGTRPAGRGLHDGKLAPCPASPNCVSSQSTDREHAIDPLRYTGSLAGTMADLTKIITGMPRARVVTGTENYLHVEFTSAIFRFVDDVEFFIDEGSSVIHVRSASRLGHSDLGVNRKRIEAIQNAWMAGPGHALPSR